MFLGDTFFPDVLFLSSKNESISTSPRNPITKHNIDLKYSFQILEYSFISQLQQFSSQYKKKLKRIFSKDILPVFIVFSFIHGISTISYSSNFPLNLLQFPPDKWLSLKSHWHIQQLQTQDMNYIQIQLPRKVYLGVYLKIYVLLFFTNGCHNVSQPPPAMANHNIFSFIFLSLPFNSSSFLKRVSLNHFLLSTEFVPDQL